MTNGLIPQATIDDIASRLDIIEIIKDYVPLRKQGRNYLGICPFHHEKTPSFTVSPDKQMFYCFGCGAGGNIFTFLMQKEGLTFPEAVEKLALKAGVSISKTQLNPERQKILERKDRLYRINAEAANFFRRNLFSSRGLAPKALQYLRQRGLGQETIEKFQLGLAVSHWDALTKHLISKGVKIQELIELGLSLPNKQGNGYYDRFRNRIMFPIWDSAGRVIAFGGRILDESLPKYLNSPDTPLFNKSRNLYSIHLAKNSIRQEDMAVIVEGYLDVLQCHQHGISNAVASLGTAFTEEQAKLLMRYTYQHVLIYDADLAGSKATLRGLDILSQLGSEVKVVSLPEGTDPDDFLRINGVEKLRELITNSQGLIEYKLNKALEAVGTTSVMGKTKAVQAIAQDLLNIKSPLARSGAIQLVGEKTGFTEASILAELRKFNLAINRGNKAEKEINQSNLSKIRAINKTQLQLIKILFENTSLLTKVEQEGGEKLFDPPLSELYLKIYNNFQRKGSVLASDFDMENGGILAAALLENVTTGEEKKAVADYIKILKLGQLNKEYVLIEKRLKTAEINKDIAKQEDLLCQLGNILKQKRLLTP